MDRNVFIAPSHIRYSKTVEGDVLKIVKELTRRVVGTRDRNAIISTPIGANSNSNLYVLQVVETSNRIGTFV